MRKEQRAIFANFVVFIGRSYVYGKTIGLLALINYQGEWESTFYVHFLFLTHFELFFKGRKSSHKFCTKFYSKIKLNTQFHSILTINRKMVRHIFIEINNCHKTSSHLRQGVGSLQLAGSNWHHILVGATVASPQRLDHNRPIVAVACQRGHVVNVG